jgi:N-methylhydantoinase A/oxoprolinase/acetone carboxylase beta subunit
LHAGKRISGPAIVNQMDTTNSIPQGWVAEIIGSGALVLKREHP